MQLKKIVGKPLNFRDSQGNVHLGSIVDRTITPYTTSPYDYYSFVSADGRFYADFNAHGPMRPRFREAGVLEVPIRGFDSGPPGQRYHCQTIPYRRESNGVVYESMGVNKLNPVHQC